jgi:hypothetical protein
MNLAERLSFAPLDRTRARCAVGLHFLMVFVFVGASLLFLPTALKAQSSWKRTSGPLGSSHDAQGMLYFELNTGQFDSTIRYIARAPGLTALLTNTGAILSPSRNFEVAKASTRHTANALPAPPAASGAAPAAIRLSFLGSNPHAEMQSRGLLDGKINYLIGSDASQWHTRVPIYSRVKIANIYRGIDLTYYSRGLSLEYDFALSPHADPELIRISIEGADNTGIDRTGNVVMHTVAGDIVLRKPYVFQTLSGKRRKVRGHFTVIPSEGENRRTQVIVTFSIAAYDHRRPLVIDPQVVYSTYLGGTGDNSGPLRGRPGDFIGGINVSDGASGVALGPDNTSYVTGAAYSTGFPVSPDGFQQSNRAGPNKASNVFIAKLDTTKSGAASLIYATYLGGSGQPSATSPTGPLGDQADGIAVDGTGHAYVAGFTYSTDFPVFPNPGAYETTNNQSAPSNGNGFVAELSSDGSTLVYSTYINGSSGIAASGIAVKPGCVSGCEAYVVGEVRSADFATVNAYQSSKPSAEGAPSGFVLILSADGSAARYASFLGGTTSYGGIRERLTAVTVDPSGIAYVTGGTNTFDFPTTPDAYQGTNNADPGSGGTNIVVAEIDPSKDNSATLVYSTLLGGSSYYYGFPLPGDIALAIAIDDDHRIYLTGSETSNDLPVANAYQPEKPGITVYDGLTTIAANAFVSVLDPRQLPSGQLIYSTYLGGNPYLSDSGSGIAVASNGQVIVGGITSSANFPISSNACTPELSGLLDTFVTELDITQAPAYQLSFSSFFGSAPGAAAFGLAIDSSDDVYLAGGALPNGLPVTATAFQAASKNPYSSAFLAKLDPSSGFCWGAPGRGRIRVAKSVTLRARVGLTITKSLRVKNAGKDVLTGTISAPDAPFTLVSGGGDFTLEPKAKRTLIVGFSAPPEKGKSPGSILISSNDAKHPLVIVKLKGVAK